MSNDTIQTATPLSPTSQTFNDFLSNSDLNDYFRFTLTHRSSISLILGNLTADANVQLLDAGGLMLQSSTNQGQASELIGAILNAGTYHIRVYLGNSDAANYTLTLDLQPGGEINTIWRDYGTGENVIWTMGGTNNTSPLASVPLPSAPTNWAIVGMADWNQDGTQDIVWRDYTYGDNGIWIMGGTNNTEVVDTVLLPDAPVNWQIGGVGDFNRDGSPDIFWHETTVGYTGVWYIDGNFMTQLFTLSIHPDARVQGIIDFNQDGEPDILWKMPDGSNLIRFMEETELQSVGILESSPITTWITPFQTGNLAPIDAAGNTTATALNIGPLTGTAIFRDRIDANDSEDYFRFTLDSSYDVTLAISGLFPSSVELLNSAGTVLTNTTNLSAGTYFVRVFGGSGDYTLALTATAPPAPPPPSLPVVTISGFTNASEPNTNGSFTITRTGNSAQALSVSYAIGGTATPGTDYQTLGTNVVIPAGQSSITISVTVNDDSEEEEEETVTLTLTPEETYTLGTLTSQTITIADDDLSVIPPGDAGNTLETAKNLGIVRLTPITQSDRVDSSDKKDYYRVVMPVRGRIRATITGTTADIDIELLDATGYLIDFSDHSGIKDESISRVVPAGTYYLFVYPYGNAESNYTLNVWRV